MPGGSTYLRSPYPHYRYPYHHYYGYHRPYYGYCYYPYGLGFGYWGSGFGFSLGFGWGVGYWRGYYGYGWPYYGYGWPYYHCGWPYYWRYPRYCASYYCGPYYWYWPGYSTVRYVYDGYDPYYSDGSTIIYNYYNYDEEDPVAYDGAAPPPPAEPVGAGAESKGAAEDQDEFLEGLSPAELSFVTGLASFRGGEYEAAAEAWYTATLKSPDAAAPRAFLAVALFALGEFQRAQEYLADALAKEPDLPRYRWDVRRLYGKTNATGFDRHLATLDSYIELYPNRSEGYLIRGFVLSAAGDEAGAARAFGMALSIDKDQVVAQAFQDALQVRAKGGPEEPVFDELQTFLTTLRLEDVKRLDL